MPPFRASRHGALYSAVTGKRRTVRQRGVRSSSIFGLSVDLSSSFLAEATVRARVQYPHGAYVAQGPKGFLPTDV